MASPDPSPTPPYRPAPYLVSGPGAFLTSDELVRYFEDFYASLPCVNTAPQMVFERLIGNLGASVHAAIENARRAGASEALGASITCLQPPAAAALPSPMVVSTANVEQPVHHSPHVIRSFSVNSSSSVRTKEFPTVGKVDLSRFIVALTSFNIPADVQVDVSASITTPVDTGFTVSLSDTSISPASTGVDSATCSWIELGAHAADMQCGSLRRNDNPDADLLKRTTTHQVSFPMTYSEPPQVVVWLRGLHLSPSDQRTVKLQVVQIYNWGFNLEVICGTAANPHDVEISWLACLAGVTTGDFAGGNVSGVTKCEGYFAFKAGRFETPPRVVAGLTGFGNNKQVAFSLAVRVVQVTCEGVKWRIDGGPDGHFGFAKGSFIAFE